MIQFFFRSWRPLNLIRAHQRSRIDIKKSRKNYFRSPEAIAENDSGRNKNAIEDEMRKRKSSLRVYIGHVYIDHLGFRTASAIKRVDLVYFIWIYKWLEIRTGSYIWNIEFFTTKLLLTRVFVSKPVDSNKSLNLNSTRLPNIFSIFLSKWTVVKSRLKNTRVGFLVLGNRSTNLIPRFTEISAAHPKFWTAPFLRLYTKRSGWTSECTNLAR